MKQLESGRYEVPDSHGIVLALIPAGSFVMGSGEAEVGRREDETPHEVTISRPFYMGVAEVTQQQYMNATHPDHEEDGINKGPWGHHLPAFYRGGPWGVERTHVKSPLGSGAAMEMLSWRDSTAFAEWLTKREAAAGRLPDGYVYRLPTEAEWEYACRAGRDGPFGVEGDRSEFIFTTSAFDGRLASPHGRRKPNPQGLYDMHGMVYEWVLDWYGPYGMEAETDPTGPETGTERVMRGGCYVSARDKIGGRDATEAEMLRSIRSASRNHLPPDFKLPITGMRVALAPEVRGGYDVAAPGSIPATRRRKPPPGRRSRMFASSDSRSPSAGSW
jgi:formylglycine-generating enzyme required for sulfatase activity